MTSRWESDTQIINTQPVQENISNGMRYGSRSIMGANCKHLNRKYCMDESNVYSKWKHVCANNEELIRICM